LTSHRARVSSERQSRSAEEIGLFPKEWVGAEGATAPEPLRQKDRRLMALWKAAGLAAGSPKG
jgi:hypothetical protein